MSIEKATGIASVPTPSVTAVGTAAPSKPHASFADVLHAVGEEAKRGERLVERASHGGGDMSASDLLRLQAGVYRWVETVDLASKLVDRATQAAKQVTQSNGG